MDPPLSWVPDRGTGGLTGSEQKFVGVFFMTAPNILVDQPSFQKISLAKKARPIIKKSLGNCF